MSQGRVSLSQPKVRKILDTTVASSATGAIVSATVALSDLSLLSVGGVFRTSFVIVLPRLCYGADSGRFD